MPFNILIVDDSRTVRRVLRRAIDLAGLPAAEFFEASNGAEALEHLRGGHPVDIVLTDVHMPVMTGVQLVQEIRGDQNLRSLPVVVLTSDTSASRREQLEQLGVRAFLGKPFQPETIRDVLVDLMEPSDA